MARRLAVVVPVLLLAPGCHRSPPVVKGPPVETLVMHALSDDPATRRAATAMLMARHDPKATALLSKHLTDDDPHHIIRAMNALVSIGDPRAVPGLIKLSRLTDPSFTPKVIQAIGLVGGHEAEAYLFTVETGSRNPAVRAAAKAARSDLVARRAARAGAQASSADRGG